MTKLPAFPKTKTEGNVKRGIKRILASAGWFYWMPPANGFGASGISDIHAVWNSVFMVIEAKEGKNKPTPLQVGFLNSIRAEGHFAFVVNDANVGALKVFVDDLAFSTRCVQRGEKVPDETGARMLNCISALTELIPTTRVEQNLPKIHPSLGEADDADHD